MKLSVSEKNQIGALVSNNEKAVRQVVSAIDKYDGANGSLVAAVEAIEKDIEALEIENPDWEILSCAKGVLKNRIANSAEVQLDEQPIYELRM